VSVAPRCIGLAKFVEVGLVAKSKSTTGYSAVVEEAEKAFEGWRWAKHAIAGVDVSVLSCPIKSLGWLCSDRG